MYVVRYKFQYVLFRHLWRTCPSDQMGERIVGCESQADNNGRDEDESSQNSAVCSDKQW